MPLITPGARVPEQIIDARGSGPSTATFTDPHGAVWPMSDLANGWVALGDGMSGLGAVPRTLTTDPHPRGGARLRHIQPEARTIVWPLLVKGRDHQEFLDRWHALAGAFTLTNRLGPGLLEFQHPDGSRRQIEVYYQEGFEGRGKPGYGGLYDVAVITLWCGDPYWVDPVPQTIRREYTAASAEDFLASFPSLTSGQVLGATTVVNTGDVVMWPEWVVSGPATSVVFTNEDTGDSFTLDPSTITQTLDAGETVTITTDPMRVRFQDGSNWIGALDWPGAVLWGLEPGANSVTFTLNGAAAGSAVELTYHPRYETV